MHRYPSSFVRKNEGETKLPRDGSERENEEIREGNRNRIRNVC